MHLFFRRRLFFFLGTTGKKLQPTQATTTRAQRRLGCRLPLGSKQVSLPPCSPERASSSCPLHGSKPRLGTWRPSPPACSPTSPLAFLHIHSGPSLSCKYSRPCVASGPLPMLFSPPVMSSRSFVLSFICLTSMNCSRSWSQNSFLCIPEHGCTALCHGIYHTELQPIC